MLQLTRTQTTAILATIFVLCGFLVPNFVSNGVVESWPEWAQRRITLAPELQGGTSLVLEVDQSRVREYVLNDVLYEVRDILRDARIDSASRVTIRNGGIEVRPFVGDFRAALANLSKLSRAFDGDRAEVADAGDGLIRVIPSEARIAEYERPTVNRSIAEIRARLLGVPASVEREAPWRVRVQMPGQPLEALNRLKW